MLSGSIRGLTDGLESSWLCLKTETSDLLLLTRGRLVRLGLGGITFFFGGSFSVETRSDVMPVIDSLSKESTLEPRDLREMLACRFGRGGLTGLVEQGESVDSELFFELIGSFESFS